MNTESTSPSSLIELRSLAVSTFGSESMADNWLNEFHLILGETPIVAAKSTQGLKEVEKILTAIAFGGVV